MAMVRRYIHDARRTDRRFFCQRGRRWPSEDDPSVTFFGHASLFTRDLRTFFPPLDLR
jgi:hypothetical protein